MIMTDLLSAEGKLNWDLEPFKLWICLSTSPIPGLFLSG